MTVNIWTDRLGLQNGWDTALSIRNTRTFGSSTVIEDINLTEEYSGFEGVNFNLGALWNVNDHLTLGAVFKSPFKGELHYKSREASFTTDPDGNITGEFHGSYSEENKLKMPMSYGLGIAWRFSDAFTMDLDIYRTDWSNYVLINGKGEEFSPIEASLWSKANVKDTTQVRLGSEYLKINPNKGWVIPIRGGIFYDPEPYLDKTRDFYGFSIGSGFGYKRLVFDAAYQLRWGHDLYTGWDRVDMSLKSTMDVKQHSFLLSFIFYL
jgi:long-subunit fatty acid transport protein